jgi:hypothetical protein
MWVSPCMKRKIVRELMETSGVMHNSYLLSSPIKSRPIRKYNTYRIMVAALSTTMIVSYALTSSFTHHPCELHKRPWS